MALEALAWRSGREWCAWHLAPEGTDETLCGLHAIKSGPWTISREPFGSFAMDPTSCRSCLEQWLRNRGKELHRDRKPTILGKPRCEVEDHRPEDAGDGTLFCPTCKLPVEYA